MENPRTLNLPYLDGWRGLAIVLVLISHFTYDPSRHWVGEIGVALFFVLSGYLMAGLLFLKKVPLLDFFVRRFNRVFPVFALFVASIAVWAHVNPPAGGPPQFGEIAATFTFMRTYWPDASIWAKHQWPIGHLWSLNVEEHSYVFLAMIALMVTRLKSRYVPALVLTAVTLAILALNMYWFSTKPKFVSPWQIHSETASLGLIAAAAIRVLRSALEPHRLDRFIPTLAPFLPFVVGILCFTMYFYKGFSFTVGPIAFALTVNYLDKIPEFFKSLLSANWLRWFGKASFSLYVWQQPFFEAARGGSLHAGLAFVAAMVLGTLSFYLIEDPTRTWLNGKWSERRRKSVPEAALAS